VAVEKALNKNVDTRAFFAYLAEHVELLPEFTSVDPFEQSIWKSYTKAHQALYERVVTCFKTAEERRKEIEQPLGDVDVVQGGQAVGDSVDPAGRAIVDRRDQVRQAGVAGPVAGPPVAATPTAARPPRRT
jgi:hypothetical protein